MELSESLPDTSINKYIKWIIIQVDIRHKWPLYEAFYITK